MFRAPVTERAAHVKIDRVSLGCSNSLISVSDGFRLLGFMTQN